MICLERLVRNRRVPVAGDLGDAVDREPQPDDEQRPDPRRDAHAADEPWPRGTRRRDTPSRSPCSRRTPVSRTRRTASGRQNAWHDFAHLPHWMQVVLVAVDRARRGDRRRRSTGRRAGTGSGTTAVRSAPRRRPRAARRSGRPGRASVPRILRSATHMYGSVRKSTASAMDTDIRNATTSAGEHEAEDAAGDVEPPRQLEVAAEDASARAPRTPPTPCRPGRSSRRSRA